MKRILLLTAIILLLVGCVRYKDGKPVNEPEKKEEPVAIEEPKETPEEKTNKALKENKYADVISVNGQFEAEPYTVHVELQGQESLTTNMTVKSMKLAIREVLYSVKGLDLKFSNVGVSVKYPLTDQYGNSNDEFVIKSNFGAETIGKMNKDKNKLDADNLPVIADEWWEHPALSK
ncbi:hypothetical protein NCCP2716_23400 [Sporosarcina sp. NCCP-2716]|uniref:hypothetical protein n=1 Tax=Sporosarcina sp. NCCP-2716 TaxID=2943679 RepID=UPI0020406204|nr:hypothetical protein [Sporosarcina sp. NCCP-2716]GKV69842.1 hypothetical protein NCCP2716_23400 [Sporosarcina sp. NCCP-2716]